MSADFSTRARPRSASGLTRVFVAIGGILLLAALARAWSARTARETAREELVRLRREVQEQRQRVDMLQRKSGREATLERQTELTARAAPPRVIADLAALLPGGVLVERLVLDYEDRLGLELRVEARSAQEYDRFLHGLFTSARLETVLPGPESREGALASTVKATYRPLEAP